MLLKEMAIVKVAIIGAGAMGSLFAALLSPRADVVLVGRSAEHIDAMRSTGLSVEHMDGSLRRYRVKATSDLRSIAQEANLVLVFTKSHHTREAARSARTVLNRDGLALTLQNGIGNLEILSEVLGASSALAGVTSHGATFIDYGLVRHAGAGPTYLGSCPGRKALLDEVVFLFNESGIQTTVSDDLEGIIWGKLVVNAGINALAAILRVPNGKLIESDECSIIMQGAVKEAAAVAKASGISLPFADPMNQVRQVCRNTARNRASMLQDILRGTATEIDAINGAIVGMGRKLGIETPYNTALTGIVHTLEATAADRIREE